MFLSDLPVGTPIILEIVAGSKKFNVPVTIKKKEPNSIFTEIFKYGGKVIDFSQKGFEHLMFNVYATSSLNQGGRFVWKNVVMELVHSRGEDYYKLHTKANFMQGASLNRREEKRQQMDTPGQAFSMNTGFGSAVLIHDISSQGISFISGPGFAAVGEVVDLRFIEVVGDRTFDIGTAVQVVRIVPKTHGNVLYGCKVINPSREFQTFVNIKALYEKRL